MTTSIILLKTKEETSQEAIDNYYKNLHELKEKIPGIISITGGKNIPTQVKNKEFNQGAVIVFKDEEARKNYSSHEEHSLFLRTYAFPIMDDFLLFDF